MDEGTDGEIARWQARIEQAAADRAAQPETMRDIVRTAMIGLPENRRLVISACEREAVAESDAVRRFVYEVALALTLTGGWATNRALGILLRPGRLEFSGLIGLRPGDDIDDVSVQSRIILAAARRAELRPDSDGVNEVYLRAALVGAFGDRDESGDAEAFPFLARATTLVDDVSASISDDDELARLDGLRRVIASATSFASVKVAVDDLVFIARGFEPRWSSAVVDAALDELVATADDARSHVAMAAVEGLGELFVRYAETTHGVEDRVRSAIRVADQLGVIATSNRWPYVAATALRVCHEGVVSISSSDVLSPTVNSIASAVSALLQRAIETSDSSLVRDAALADLTVVIDSHPELRDELPLDVRDRIADDLVHTQLTAARYRYASVDAGLVDQWSAMACGDDTAVARVAAASLAALDPSDAATGPIIEDGISYVCRTATHPLVRFELYKACERRLTMAKRSSADLIPLARLVELLETQTDDATIAVRSLAKALATDSEFVAQVLPKVLVAAPDRGAGNVLS